MAADVIPIITKLRSYSGMIRMASRRAVAGSSIRTRPQVGRGTLHTQQQAAAAGGSRGREQAAEECNG
jgi:hypothetical protein